MRGSRVLKALLGGIVVAVGVGIVSVSYFVPPDCGVIEGKLIFAATDQSQVEPIATTGKTGDGDFVFVRYLSTMTVVFGYDRWGTGGPSSEPITVTPGHPYRFRLESPSFAQVRGTTAPPPTSIRMWFEGKAVFAASGGYELVRPSRVSSVWLGENPIGGTPGPSFSGKIVDEAGRMLRGRERRSFTTAERLSAWLQFGRLQIAGALLSGLLAAGACGSAPRWLAPCAAMNQAGWTGRHAAFVAAALPSLAVFLWFATDYNWRLFEPEVFGDFYDYQAASLIQGRLDVPRVGIGNEAFVSDGKSYGYFGLTPAVLRLPFTVFDIEWGCLSRVFCLAYYAACLIAAYALLRRAIRQSGREEPSGFATAIFTLTVGLGSTLLFLGTRSWVYHEAILCGVAFALWSVWFALRWLDMPASRRWIGALVLALLCVNARQSVGLFAVGVLGLVSISVALRSGRFRQPILVAFLSAGALFSFNAVAYLKFHSFAGAPISRNVQYDAARLARSEGRVFQPANFRFNADAYLLRSNMRLAADFPWVFMDKQPKDDYPEARMDYIEHTAALPIAMPALLLLALASLWPPRRGFSNCPDILVLWLAFVPLFLSMLAFFAVAERYTADFVPFLVAAAATGLANFALVLTRFWERLLRLGLVTVSAISIAVTLAISMWYQGEKAWGTPAPTKAAYKEFKGRIDDLFKHP